MDTAILTCAVTVSPTPIVSVPVTVEEMAASCKEAYDAGASIMHIPFSATRTEHGTVSKLGSRCGGGHHSSHSRSPSRCHHQHVHRCQDDDVSGPLAAWNESNPRSLHATQAPQLSEGPLKRTVGMASHVFNKAKINRMLKAMHTHQSLPEMECFDVGIVRSVEMYEATGMCEDPHYNFVRGGASGMPCDPDLLALLMRYKKENALWQVTAIGRDEVWKLHQKTAELGGMLRTGLEDTFYLPNGEKASGNGPLIEALAQTALSAGRSVASPSEARNILGLSA